MAITPAFQADNAGSIPAARSKFSSLKSTSYGWFFRFWHPIKIHLWQICGQLVAHTNFSISIVKFPLQLQKIISAV